MPKNSQARVLTKLETMSFLHRLKQQELKDIAEIFEITLKQARKIRRDHIGDHPSEEKINNAIRMIELQIGHKNYDEDHWKRNYKKQESCEHKDFTIFLKCKCSKILSENDLDEIIEICQRKKESLKVGVRVFSLVDNKTLA